MSKKRVGMAIGAVVVIAVLYYVINRRTTSNLQDYQ
jgi:hypothetical protein